MKSCGCYCHKHDRAKVFKHIITKEDVRKRFIKIGGTNHVLTASVGYIQKIDIGKTLYLKDNHISMSASKA